jgi:hypothetical protein
MTDYDDQQSTRMHWHSLGLDTVSIWAVSARARLAAAVSECIEPGMLSPISGMMSPAFPPRIRPVAENADRIVGIANWVRDHQAFIPMLEVDQRNAAIIDALVARGEVTLTAGANGLEVS